MWPFSFLTCKCGPVIAEAKGAAKATPVKSVNVLVKAKEIFSFFARLLPDRIWLLWQNN